MIIKLAIFMATSIGSTANIKVCPYKEMMSYLVC